MGGCHGSTNNLELQVLACCLAQGGGQLHAAYVLAGDVVRAAFEQQHAVAVLQAADALCALKVLCKQPFLPGQHYAEAGQRHVGGHYGGHLLEGLAVGDHQRRWLLERRQRRWQLLGLAEEGLRVQVHQVAQHLHLRQYHPPFGGRAVYGRHQHNGVALAYDVAQQRASAVGALRQGFLYLRYQRVLIDWGFLCQHLEQRCAVLRAPTFHHLLRLAVAAFGVEQQRQVHFGQRRHALLHAHLAQLALVVDAGGVYQHHRPYAANLHALAYGVGGGAGGVADDGYLLAGEEVHHSALAYVAAAKEAYSRFQFVAFHCLISLFQFHYCDAFAAKLKLLGVERANVARRLQLLTDYLHQYAVAFAV